MCDQLRADALGCTGNWVKTPNIDRIAREGVRFSNCVTNAPVCIPARVSLATGHYPHNTGVYRNVGQDGGYSVAGAVAPSGAIRVTVAEGGRSASGVGRLVGNSGSGVWRTSTGECSGQWAAARHAGW